MRWWMWTGLAIGCAEAPEDEPSPSTTEEQSEGAEWAARLIGTWVGQADTPMGPMPFAMVGKGRRNGVRTSIEQYGLRFVLDFGPTPDGFGLTERGELPGGFVQEHDLLLDSLDGDEARWTSVEPGLMDIVTEVRDDVWTLDVMVRGEPHCTWTLERQ